MQEKNYSLIFRGFYYRARRIFGEEIFIGIEFIDNNRIEYLITNEKGKPIDNDFLHRMSNEEFRHLIVEVSAPAGEYILTAVPPTIIHTKISSKDILPQ